jgi:hypothetical protein
MANEPLGSISMQPTMSFYPRRTEGAEPIDVTEDYDIPSGSDLTLTFGYSKSLAASEMDYIRRMITKSLPEKVKVQFQSVDRTKPGWLDRFLNMDDLDGRIQLVDVGGDYLTAAVKMMFCTRLGVRFPDSSGEICRLVNETEARANAATDDDIRRFNSALVSQSEVIPIFSTGVFWLYSKSLDPKSISPTVLDPRMDLLRLGGD